MLVIVYKISGHASQFAKVEEGNLNILISG